MVAHQSIQLPNIEKYFTDKEVTSRIEEGYDRPAWDSMINEIKTPADLSYLRYLTLNYGSSSYYG